jgi:hypothetical protein
MSNRSYPPLAVVLGLGVHASLSLAQPQPPARHPCVAITDDAARLACYDQEFGRPGSVSPAPIAVAAAAAPAAPSTHTASTATGAGATAVGVAAVDSTATAREEFGLSEADKQARAASQGAPPAPDHIEGKVTSVTRRANGELVVTLEGGQVWVELETNTGATLKPGDTVTIRKAALGSFMLVTPKHIATHVRRLK